MAASEAGNPLLQNDCGFGGEQKKAIDAQLTSRNEGYATTPVEKDIGRIDEVEVR